MEKPSAGGELEGERWRQRDSREFLCGNKKKQLGQKKKKQLNQNPKKETQMRQKNPENSKKRVGVTEPTQQMKLRRRDPNELGQLNGYEGVKE